LSPTLAQGLIESYSRGSEQEGNVGGKEGANRVNAGVSEVPLIWVFLGERLPDYAISAIELNAQTSGFDSMWLLANGVRPRGLPSSIRYVGLEEFYSDRRFTAFSEKSNLSRDFRDGFWLKATERLFVLESFASAQKIDAFVHAELDVLVMRPYELLNEIHRSGLAGLFAPRETLDRTMASFLFCNSLKALAEILDFFIEHPEIGNEMDMLGHISRHKEELGLHALPTAEVLYRQKSTFERHISWPIIGWKSESVVDGAVLGRWLLGVDPRNTSNRGTKNLLQNPPYTVHFPEPLNKLSFRFNKRSWALDVRSDGEWKKVVALHVHSKVFNRLSPNRMSRIVYRANQGKPSFIVWPKPVKSYRKFKRILKDLKLLIVNSRFRRREANRWWDKFISFFKGS
jgi:hypothetical protein